MTETRSAWHVSTNIGFKIGDTMTTETVSRTTAFRVGILLLLAAMALMTLASFAMAAAPAKPSRAATTCYELPDGTTDCGKG